MDSKSKIPDVHCKQHPDMPFEWFKDWRERNIFACKKCHGMELTEVQNSGPLIKYSPTFHRDRPLTDKEKQFPARKGT